MGSELKIVSVLGRRAPEMVGFAALLYFEFALPSHFYLWMAVSTIPWVMALASVFKRWRDDRREKVERRDRREKAEHWHLN